MYFYIELKSQQLDWRLASQKYYVLIYAHAIDRFPLLVRNRFLGTYLILLSLPLVSFHPFSKAFIPGIV